MKRQKVEGIGTVWTAVARIKYLDNNHGHWVTVGGCIDTPNAIKAALATAKSQYPGKTLWVHSDTMGKYIP